MTRAVRAPGPTSTPGYTTSRRRDGVDQPHAGRVITLNPDTAPRTARRIVAQRCTAAGVGASAAMDAALLSCELVTNAVMHGRGPILLAVQAGDRCIRVEVADSEPRPPRLSDTGPDAEGGRGMFLINAMASTWGTTPTGTGKTVWFELLAHPDQPGATSCPKGARSLY